VFDASTTAPTNVDYVTLKGGGTTMGYYALPILFIIPIKSVTGALTAISPELGCVAIQHISHHYTGSRSPG
jgi:hypothetical protein